MRYCRVARSALLGGVVALACADGHPLGPDGDAAIQTDAALYALRMDGPGWATEIPFTYRNPTDGPWFLPNCNGGYSYSLEKRIGRGWRVAYEPVLQACLSPVIRIEPGTTFVGTIGLWAGFPGSNWHPKFAFTEPEGTYRIVLQTLSSYADDRYPFGPSLALEQRVSNAFELRVDDTADR